MSDNGTDARELREPNQNNINILEELDIAEQKSFDHNSQIDSQIDLNLINEVEDQKQQWDDGLNMNSQENK